ncbi:MAG: tetratricopeptide repeat protein [Gemmataceae bacterium]|nr:tetratricopeptide repeat protein [Gemmataceae bacterium]
MPRSRLPRVSPRVTRGLVFLVLASGLVVPQLWAWHRLRAARAALARHHPAAARESLAACLRLWPDRPAVHLLASRAARQAGDLEDADARLRTCHHLSGGTSDEIAFEWALLQAAGGNVREVEEYLQRRADQTPGEAALVWEALAEGYLRVYRTPDAMACLEHWLDRDRDNVRALELRGITFVTGKGVKRGADDFRQVLTLDPTRADARWRLARCLLDLGGYDEAVPHLERLLEDRPDDPEVLVRLARCHNMLGRGDLARETVDAVLATHPDHGLGLRTRGQFTLAAQKPAEAEGWLRRAAAALPEDYQTQWLLFQALQQQGKTEEAAAQIRTAEQVRDRVERLGELQSRKLAEQPLDPALHYEMGVLLIRTGHPTTGEGWLVSALRLDPGYRPAHAALAEYYDRLGDKGRAADHRRRAAE